MKNLFLLLAFFTSFSLNAQETLIYQNEGKPIKLQVSKDQYYVIFKKENKEAIKRKVKEYIEISGVSALIKIEVDSQNVFEARKPLIAQKFETQLQQIEPVLTYEDGTKQICNGQLIIKLHNEIPLNDIFSKWKYEAVKDEFTENQFLVKIENISTHQLFSLINELGKNKNVEFAEPNFTRFLKPHTSDPYFSSQWAINNQGYLGGTVDADMDVDNAWAFASGQGVKIAIIDEGVELTHPDLVANLLPGYDATGNSSNGAPNISTDDSHGTNCAGIAGAVANNNKGTAGIAYNSKIIPIRIAYSNGYPLYDDRRKWIAQDSWIKNGINWAVNNGAEILSCSWGGGTPSSTITNAINNAVTNGRNLKGCIVFFSTGNENSSVIYPAKLPNVIAVGASSMCDERKSPTSCDGEDGWGSNYGNELDIVAPGVKIYTTDITGWAGYDIGDYNSEFNGTSSACPNAAGVAALILAINPNFTQTQVRQILESTTDKIGNSTYLYNPSQYPNGTWNNQVGYGRLNAYKAVAKAITTATSISGPSFTCTSTNATFTVNNVPIWCTVIWNNSSNLILSSTSGNTATFTANGSGVGWVKASLSSSGSSIDLPANSVVVSAPNYYTINASYTSGGSTDWLQDNNCLLTYTFPGMYSGTIDISDPCSNQIAWTKVSQSPGTSFAYITPANDGKHAEILIKPLGSSAVFRMTASNQCGSYTHNYTFVAKTPETCIRIVEMDIAEPIVTVTPNPASNDATIRLVEPQTQTDNAGNEVVTSFEKPNKSYTLRVFSSYGSLVYTARMSGISFTISTSNYINGIYVVEITDGVKSYKKQLVVKH